jgi:hypothetical protein
MNAAGVSPRSDPGGTAENEDPGPPGLFNALTVTEAPLGQSIKPCQSGGVSVLTEGAGFIVTQHVVSEAAQPGEDTGVVTYAG